MQPAYHPLFACVVRFCGTSDIALGRKLSQILAEISDIWIKLKLSQLIESCRCEIITLGMWHSHCYVLHSTLLPLLPLRFPLCLSPYFPPLHRPLAHLPSPSSICLSVRFQRVLIAFMSTFVFNVKSLAQIEGGLRDGAMVWHVRGWCWKIWRKKNVDGGWGVDVPTEC